MDRRTVGEDIQKRLRDRERLASTHLHRWEKVSIPGLENMFFAKTRPRGRHTDPATWKFRNLHSTWRLPNTDPPRTGKWIRLDRKKQLWTAPTPSVMTALRHGQWMKEVLLEQVGPRQDITPLPVAKFQHLLPASHPTSPVVQESPVSRGELRGATEGKCLKCAEPSVVNCPAGHYLCALHWESQ